MTLHTDAGRVISVIIGYFGITFFGILIAVAAASVRRSLPTLPKKQKNCK